MLDGSALLIVALELIATDFLIKITKKNNKKLHLQDPTILNQFF
jgi:hypothetical protein